MPWTNFPKGISLTTGTGTVDGFLNASNGSFSGLLTVGTLTVSGPAAFSGLVTVGTVSVSGSVLGSKNVYNILFAGASTAAEAAYLPVMVAGTVVAKYQIASGTVGTGATLLFYVTDTAGANILSAALASAGTAGVIGSFSSTTASVVVTTAQGICVIKASCATAYGVGLSITIAPTA
jgi:hypothetical protein